MRRKRGLMLRRRPVALVMILLPKCPVAFSGSLCIGPDVAPTIPGARAVAVESRWVTSGDSRPQHGWIAASHGCGGGRAPPAGGGVLSLRRARTEGPPSGLSSEAGTWVIDGWGADTCLEGCLGGRGEEGAGVARAGVLAVAGLGAGAGGGMRS